MYNFYQYEKARTKTLQIGNEPLLTSIASTISSPNSSISPAKTRSKSQAGGQVGPDTQASVQLKNQQDVNKYHEKRERLVEGYKSRVAGFIKDVRKSLLNLLLILDDCETCA